jgi:hypothetical protein
MPQLDLNAYLTNFFWFVLIFFIFYITVIKIYLPRLFRVFFYRFLLSQIFVFRSRRHRTRLDYYSNLYQFLESVLNYSLANSILEKFKQSINFQNQVIFVASVENIVNLEQSIEQTFEVNDIETFELNSSLFLVDLED